jgi:hypothetical protein
MSSFSLFKNSVLYLPSSSEALHTLLSYSLLWFPIIHITLIVDLRWTPILPVFWIHYFEFWAYQKILQLSLWCYYHCTLAVFAVHGFLFFLSLNLNFLLTSSFMNHICIRISGHGIHLIPLRIFLKFLLPRLLIQR